MGINKNFVVKNGIEVNDDLLYGNPTTKRIGIGKTNASYKLDVNGDVGVTSLTVSAKLSLNGPLEINGNPGQVNQFPISTGTGVTWQNIPGQRSVTSITATENQTTINVTYNVSSGVDVFINGTRLSTSDYEASNGTQVILNVPCFGGESIDVIAYSVFGTAPPGITIQNNSTNVGTVLGINNINFVGFNTVGVTNNGLGVTIYSAPVTITRSGNRLIFTVTGIGSTSLILA